MAHGDHLKYQAKPKAGKTNSVPADFLSGMRSAVIVCHRRFDRAEYCR